MVRNLKIFKGICILDMGRVITLPADIERFYSESNAKCALEEFKHIFYQSDESNASDKGKMTDDEFFHFLRTESGSKMTPRQLQKLYYRCKGGIYKETIELIKRLKSEGYEVDLLSNLRPIDYKWLSENMNLSLFDKMFLSYQIGMSKPDEKIFKHVIDSLGTTNTYFLDDSIKNIEAAQRLGIKGIQITGKEIPTIQITDNGISKILLSQKNKNAK